MFQYHKYDPIANIVFGMWKTYWSITKWRRHLKTPFILRHIERKSQLYSFCKSWHLGCKSLLLPSLVTSKGSWETKTLHETCEQSKFQIQKSSNNHKSLFTRHISKVMLIENSIWCSNSTKPWFKCIIKMYILHIIFQTSTQSRLPKRLSGFQLWTSSWEIQTSIIWRLQIY